MFRNLFFILFLTACSSKTFSATVIQQSPARLPVSHDYARESARAIIALGDMDLGYYKLLNRAWFTIISKDRIRFYATLAHKQDDYSNPCNWQGIITIDGQKFKTQCEKISNTHKTYMWDEIALPTAKTPGGDVIITSIFPKYYTTLQSLTIYIGRSYFDVYSKDIANQMHNVELVLKQGGIKLKFKWQLVDE